MQIRSSGNKPPYRPKRYGLSLLGFNLLFALWLGLGALIGEQVDLPETGWVVASFFLGVFAPPIIAYFWDDARATRLKKRDHDAAVTAIKQPLRNAQQLDGSVVDFDPHYPTTSIGGGIVSAIDPRRRLLRIIAHGIIDSEGRSLDQTGPADGDIMDVSQKAVPGKRRWLWLLPPRAEDRRILVTVTSRGSDGKDLTLPLHFRAGDPAAFGWYHTFAQWMRDDRQRDGA